MSKFKGIQFIDVPLSKDGEPILILTEEQRKLKAHIEAVGVPLRKTHGFHINYGLKTGLDPIFILDNKTKDELICQASYLAPRSSFTP